MLNIVWRDVDLPDFGVPDGDAAPEIPANLYEERCRRAYADAACEWLVVYGDREHLANLLYLIGFDPRFEEAILVLGPAGRRVLLVGNEGLLYATLLPVAVDIVACQSLSLMGQDRSRAPRLTDVLRSIGIGAGQRVGVVGWKYLEPDEWDGDLPGFFVPALLIDALRGIAGDPTAVTDATATLMHPTRGLRARNEAEQIAAFEWAATRATRAVARVVRGTRPGMTELEAVASMRFAGEPMSTHVLFASGQDAIVGLRSPTTRRIVHGDGATTAIGFWGGLGCRAGLVAEESDEFLTEAAVPYFRGVARWYESVAIGATGGAVFDRVTATLAEGALRSMLNPGHLTSFDEWVHTPIRPASEDRLASGMTLQCDIIPVPMPAGWAVNCEDPIVLADETLRGELRERYPALWSRILGRQDFMRQELGLQIGDDVLPLSATPAYLAPFWLAPFRVLTVG